MHTQWHEILRSSGSDADAGRAGHLGDAAAEVRAARDGSIVAPLTHFGLIACRGEDAQGFLHAQLSSDVKSLAPECSQYATYCSPKGRMLANFLLWREDAGYYLQLARSLQASVQKRLAMFVLRAKVQLEDAGESRLALGVAGPAAAAALNSFFPRLPREPHEIVHDAANGTLIALPGGRFQIVALAGTIARLWTALSAKLTPVGAACWEWLDIRNGIAFITPATQDQFVPQMASMEAIGAVSFSKGCYPGQEIIARAHHLGQVKRRLVLAHLADAVAQAGDELFASGMDGAAGTVVNGQRAPEGGSDLLAVVQTPPQALHWKSQDGPLLEVRPLPYSA